MEYVDGRSLSQLLDERPLAQGEAAALARQVAQGMAAAHAQGVIHGDLKPANILVASDWTAKVMDFGMARRDRPAGQAGDTILWDPAPSGSISGTPAYMAPEQAKGVAATPASDVFSLGLILYEMVASRRARAGHDILEVLRNIDREDPAHYAAAAAEPFAGILRLALATDPAERRISMAQIAERLA
jgi:serine/threonine-protein kinase